MNVITKRFVVPLALNIALSAFVAVFVIAQTNSPTKPSAQELLSAALKTAKQENKTVMVHFGASWCGWCKRLNVFLQAPEVGKLMANHYIILELITLESLENKALMNPGAGALMAEMGGAKSGLPFYFFLDHEGKKLGDSLALPGGENIGHPNNAEEIKAFGELIERTAPRMTLTQRASILDYLTQHKTEPR